MEPFGEGLDRRAVRRIYEDLILEIGLAKRAAGGLESDFPQRLTPQHIECITLSTLVNNMHLRIPGGPTWRVLESQSALDRQLQELEAHNSLKHSTSYRNGSYRTFANRVVDALILSGVDHEIFHQAVNGNGFFPAFKEQYLAQMVSAYLRLRFSGYNRFDLAER